jgi:SOS-response transcriptional repressor LexA
MTAMTTHDTMHGLRRAVLEAVVYLCDTLPYSPSVREIGVAVACSSTSMVTYHLRALALHDYIQRTPGIARSVRPTPAGRALVLQLQEENHGKYWTQSVV